MDLGSALTAVAVSPDDRLVLVGGRDVLKTLALRADGCKEVRNLRLNKKKGLDLSVSDAKWHPFLPHIIATGATNGAVVVWDLNRKGGVGGTETTFRHNRTVNRIAWHPDQDSWLLSASQDGTIRLWDARCSPPAAGAGAGGAIFRYRYGPRFAAALGQCGVPEGGASYHPNSDVVRDASFNPFNPLSFAAGFEDGSVQLWDIRQPSGPFSRFTAHAGLVTCLQWHPSQADILATGGRDRLLKIWRVGGRSPSFLPAAGAGEGSSGGEAAGAGASPLVSIETIGSVGRLAWRSVLPGSAMEVGAPGSGEVDACVDAAWGETDGGGGVEEDASALGEVPLDTRPRYTLPPSAVDYHIATCAGLLDNNSYVWDVRHSYLPVAVYKGHREVVTGLAWVRRPLTASEGEESGSPVSQEEEALRGGSPWLLTTSKDGRLAINKPSAAARPHEALRTAHVSFGVHGVVWSHSKLNRQAFWDGTDAVTTMPPPVPLHVAAEEEEAAALSLPSSPPPPLPVGATLPSEYVRVAPPSAGFHSFSTIPGSAEWAAATVAARASLANRLPGSPARSAGLHNASTCAAVLAAFEPSAHAFAALAHAYIIDWGVSHVRCERNARAAAALGQLETAITWLTLAQLCAPPVAAPPEAPPRYPITGPVARRIELARLARQWAAESQAKAAAEAAATAAGAEGGSDSEGGGGLSGASSVAGSRAGSPGRRPRRRASRAGSDIDDGAVVSPARRGAVRSPARAVEHATASSEAVASGALDAAIQLAVAAASSPLQAAGAPEDVWSASEEAALEASLAAGGGRAMRWWAATTAARGAPGSPSLTPASLSAADASVPGYIPGLLEALTDMNPPGKKANGANTAPPSPSGQVWGTYESEPPSDFELSAAPAPSTAAGAPGGAGAVPTTATTPRDHPAGPHTPVAAISRREREGIHAALPVPGAALDLPSDAAAGAGAEGGAVAAGDGSTADDGLLRLASFQEASWRATCLDIVMDILEYFADRGDVQMCVTVSRMFGSAIEARVGKRRLQQWLVSYIDLLHRLELWAPASMVIARCSDEGVRRLNQLHTALPSLCACCGKDVEAREPPAVRPAGPDDATPHPEALLADAEAHYKASTEGNLARDGLLQHCLPPAASGDPSKAPVSRELADMAASVQPAAPTACGGCAQPISTCAVCLTPVKGMYVWCQGCGHGGHLTHMREWFVGRGMKLCPSGCQHVCALATVLQR